MCFSFHASKWTLFMFYLWEMLHNGPLFFCLAEIQEKDSVLISYENLFKRSYRLEDFFWTGSGDGPISEETWNNETETDVKSAYNGYFDTWRTTTVFHTTTILFATVYPESESCSTDCKPKVSPVWTESVEFSSPLYPSYNNIEPTPSGKQSESTLKNTTFFSEITKVLTVTKLVTATGKKSSKQGDKTVEMYPQTVSMSNNSLAGEIDEANAGGNEAAYPRFDAEIGAATTAFPVDERYWLLTVLRRDPKEFKYQLIEEKLSLLYNKAFIRQQEKHLGINGDGASYKPRRDKRIQEPVKVQIHNVTELTGQDPGIGILYSVTVAGKPVPAPTAANDMKLITIGEMVAELGYQVLTKAEPYHKDFVPWGARVKGRSRDTWLLIGAVIAAVFLLIILAVVFMVGLSTRGDSGSSAVGNSKTRKHVFSAEEGNINLTFQEDSDIKIETGGSRLREPTTKYENVNVAVTSGGNTVSFADQRRSSSSSSCSGSSEASLVRLRRQQKKTDQRKEVLENKPRPRPRTRLRKVENVDTKTEGALAEQTASGSALSRDGGMTTEGLEDVEATPCKTRTPTSFLSMPSIKAFPRGAKIPEPLSRVLEPISIRHLDADLDHFSKHMLRCKVFQENRDLNFPQEREIRLAKEKGVIRHESLEGDPGVIGPTVWKKQYFRTQYLDQDALDISDFDRRLDVGQIRKRFNDLIDNTFDVLGSNNDIMEQKEECENDTFIVRPVDNRIHSAVASRAMESLSNITSNTRPKTTEEKRPITAVMNQGPRGAWDSPNYSAISGPPRPDVDSTSILVDSNLLPNDPAIPLIKAIRHELQKFDVGSSKRDDFT